MQIILRCHLPQTLTNYYYQPPTTIPPPLRRWISAYLTVVVSAFTHPGPRNHPLGHLNLRLQTPYIQRFGMAFQSRTAFNKPTESGEEGRKAVRYRRTFGGLEGSWG